MAGARLDVLSKRLAIITILYSFLLISWNYKQCQYVITPTDVQKVDFPVAIYQNSSESVESADNVVLPVLYYECTPNVPCQYPDEVDLRVIVMTFNRDNSLKLCLDSLQNLVLDGARAAVEIWIDRDKTHTVSMETLRVANEFKWKHGTARVHVQGRHVGIYGQWIDTWRPRINTKEIAIILEDDIDISPFAFRWTKAAHAHFRNHSDISGFSLSEIDIHVGKKFYRNLPSDVNVFMFKRFGTFGFSPNPLWWRKFQDWYHYKQLASLYNPEEKPFKPYVRGDSLFTGWYKIFEKRRRADSMWSMWFEYFTDSNNLFTVFPNINTQMNYGREKNSSLQNTTFALHRREKGLHFSNKHPGQRRNSTTFLINVWNEGFVNFPHMPPKYGYRGEKIIPRISKNATTYKTKILHPNIRNTAH